MRYFMDFFVEECKKNRRAFASKTKEKSLLIYNFYPLQMTDSFQLVYIFSKNSKEEKFRTVPTYTKLTMNLQNNKFIGNSTK